MFRFVALIILRSTVLTSSLSSGSPNGATTEIGYWDLWNSIVKHGEATGGLGGLKFDIDNNTTPPLNAFTNYSFNKQLWDDELSNSKVNESGTADSEDFLAGLLWGDDFVLGSNESSIDEDGSFTLDPVTQTYLIQHYHRIRHRHHGAHWFLYNTVLALIIVAVVGISIFGACWICNRPRRYLDEMIDTMYNSTLQL